MRKRRRHTPPSPYLVRAATHCTDTLQSPAPTVHCTHCTAPAPITASPSILLPASPFPPLLTTFFSPPRTSSAAAWTPPPRSSHLPPPTSSLSSHPPPLLLPLPPSLHPFLLAPPSSVHRLPGVLALVLPRLPDRAAALLRSALPPVGVVLCWPACALRHGGGGGREKKADAVAAEARIEREVYRAVSGCPGQVSGASGMSCGGRPRCNAHERGLTSECQCPAPPHTAAPHSNANNAAPG